MTVPAVRWSTLKAIAESPLAYDWLMSHPREDTPSLLLGRALHCAVLEPSRFDASYAVAEKPDGTPMRRDARTAEYQAFLRAHPDAEILTRADWDHCRQMAESSRLDPASAALLQVQGALIEHRIGPWRDTSTGIECAGRIDHYCDGVLIDLKTTRCDLSPRALGSECARYAYHAQLAWYADGMRALGYTVERLALLWLESAPPHDIAVTYLDADAEQAGREHYRALLRRLAECRAADRWPGRYDGQAQILVVPDWADGMPDDSDITVED